MKLMTLENWMYRRDREEYYLSLRQGTLDTAWHQKRRKEAEQEIEQELRR